MSLFPGLLDLYSSSLYYLTATRFRVEALTWEVAGCREIRPADLVEMHIMLLEDRQASRSPCASRNLFLH